MLSRTLIALVALAAPIAAQTPKALEPKALGKLGRAASAYVERAGSTSRASGSAFCVHASGVFVTNAHVVKDAASIDVVLNAGGADQKILKGKVVRSDADADLALVRVESKDPLPILELGTTDDLGELQTVVAFGFPFGNRSKEDKEYSSITVSSVKISSLRNKGGKLHRIQLDGALNPGCSGGPVLDETGKVIGVVTSGIVGSGLAEAIPVSTLRTFLEKPVISFTPPKLTAAEQGKAQAFTVRVGTLLPAGKVEVELLTKAGDYETKTALTPSGTDHTASVAPHRPPTKGSLRGVIEIDGATLPVEIDDREIKIDGKPLRLSQVERLTPGEGGEVATVDGRKLAGTPSDLGTAKARVAGQVLTIDVAKATRLTVAAATVPSSVDCTIVVRVDGREVARDELTIPVAGVRESVAPAPAADRPERAEVRLPSSTDRWCVGGNGRYVVFRLPKERKIAVFDATAGRITKYLPLPEENAAIAAGQSKLYLAMPAASVVQRYDLETFEKEATAPVVVKEGALQHLVMGSASRGPIAVGVGGGGPFSRPVPLFLDADLKPIEMKPVDGQAPVHGFPKNPGGYHSRASADGATFAVWTPNQSPDGFTVVTIVGNRYRTVYEHVSLGHLSPSADGKVIYTGRGAYTPAGVGLNGAKENASREDYLVPAVHGRFYVRIPHQNTDEAGRERPRAAPTVHFEGETRPLATLKDIVAPRQFSPQDREEIGNDLRFLLVPSAKVFLYVPDSNDRIVVRKLDLEAEMDKTGIDYLFVTSSPPADAKRGSAYAYDMAIKSRRGGVRVKLESGPVGMKADPAGKITWEVPGDYIGNTAEVLLTVRDAAGQEVFHSFKISVE